MPATTTTTVASTRISPDASARRVGGSFRWTFGDFSCGKTIDAEKCPNHKWAEDDDEEIGGLRNHYFSVDFPWKFEQEQKTDCGKWHTCD